MRIVAISDTHGMHRRMAHPIPDGDVLIHCGDMTGHGRVSEVVDVARWMGSFPHRYKLAIGGNHDGALERPHAADVAACLTAFSVAGVLYLQDTRVDIEGVKFWGAPWTPNFCDWHFMPPRNGSQLKAKWDLIPDDTQVLITHGPPHGILDAYEEEGYIAKAGAIHVGCELLDARVRQLKHLKLHVFGHIHEGYGRWQGDNILFVNAAVCTRGYRPLNAPQVVDL